MTGAMNGVRGVGPPRVAALGTTTNRGRLGGGERGPVQDPTHRGPAAPDRAVPLAPAAVAVEGRDPDQGCQGKWWDGLLAQGVTELVANSTILFRAFALAWDEHDPADRIIVATALHPNIEPVAADRKMLDWHCANPKTLNARKQPQRATPRLPVARGGGRSSGPGHRRCVLGEPSARRGSPRTPTSPSGAWSPSAAVCRAPSPACAALQSRRGWSQQGQRNIRALEKTMDRA